MGKDDKKSIIGKEGKDDKKYKDDKEPERATGDVSAGDAGQDQTMFLWFMLHVVMLLCWYVTLC